MTSVHDVPKRRSDVGDRYRMTRIAFDVISAFGCLRAGGLPGPVIVKILAEHGYSDSSVHNQLVRMVHRGLLSSERIGRVSIYRLSDHIRGGFDDIAGDPEIPEYLGRFRTVVYSIPESARVLRDRLQYVARNLGYRQLRPGTLIGFVDGAKALDSLLPELEPPSWIEFAELTPANMDAARRMTSRAFDLVSAAELLPSLEARMNDLSGGGGAPGTGCPEMSLRAFFDLYFEAARSVMAHPVLPSELVEGTQPALRFRELMRRCNLEYYLRFDQQILETAAAAGPSFDLIEALPEK